MPAVTNTACSVVGTLKLRIFIKACWAVITPKRYQNKIMPTMMVIIASLFSNRHAISSKKSIRNPFCFSYKAYDYLIGSSLQKKHPRMKNPVTARGSSCKINKYLERVSTSNSFRSFTNSFKFFRSFGTFTTLLFTFF